MGRGEQAAFRFEGDLLWGGIGGERGFEITEAGVGLFERTLDPRG